LAGRGRFGRLRGRQRRLLLGEPGLGGDLHLAASHHAVQVHAWDVTAAAHGGGVLAELDEVSAGPFGLDLCLQYRHRISFWSSV
jgi:hypothetical protein